MSDSSCCECHRENCQFRDFSYECYRKMVIDIKENVNKEDIDKMKELIAKYDDGDKYSNDLICQFVNIAKEVVGMYEIILFI